MLAVCGRALMQNAMLRRRLSAQQERMNATKRSMKSIHDRLEANNERKQQLIGSLRRSRDLALIQQRNLSLPLVQDPNAGNSRVAECRNEKIPKHDFGHFRSLIYRVIQVKLNRLV